MGKFRSKDPLALPAGLWIQPGELAKGPMDGFHSKLNKVLAAMDFAGQVHQMCAPHYKCDAFAAGRPPIDPAVLFKMLMVGFPEGIGSGRGIAARCADSLIIRRFSGDALTEQTPDHSSPGVSRQRLPEEVFAAAHEVCWRGCARTDC